MQEDRLDSEDIKALGELAAEKRAGKLRSLKQVKMVVVGNEPYKRAVRNLYDAGEITLEQYAACLRRWVENGN